MCDGPACSGVAVAPRTACEGVDGMDVATTMVDCRFGGARGMVVDAMEVVTP